MPELIGFRTSLDSKARAKLEKCIDLLKLEAEEIVASTPKVATTQNNYGYYMSFIGALCSDKAVGTCFANALIRAGANQQGVLDALRVSY